LFIGPTLAGNSAPPLIVARPDRALSMTCLA
jgi:hypothetical protein